MPTKITKANESKVKIPTKTKVKFQPKNGTEKKRKLIKIRNKIKKNIQKPKYHLPSILLLGTFLLSGTAIVTGTSKERQFRGK